MTTKWHIAILCSFILAACSGQEHAEQDLELSLVDDMPIALENNSCLLYTSPSPRDRTRSRMPSSA